MDQKVTFPKAIEGQDVRQARTRAALGAALLTLLEEGPFDQMTIREITGRAKVGYATFFRHYPDKQALLHDLAEREIAKLLDMTLPILFTADSRSSARALCVYVWEHRTLWSTLLTGGAAGVLRDEFVRQTRIAAARFNDPDTPLPRDLAIVFSVTGVLEILAWWLRQSEPFTVDRMAEIVDELVVEPFIGSAEFAKY